MATLKIAAPLAKTMRETTPTQPLPVIVRFRADVRAPRALVADLPVSYVYTLIPAMALQASPERITRLAEDPAIEHIWPDLPVHTWLDVSVPLLGVPRAWDSGFKGKGIAVAVVDTGVDANHPDLAGRIIATRDFTGEGFFDGHGHGTHVCGIVAGNGTASQGKYVGVAPEASLLVAKVLRSDGTGMTSDVMAGIEWAVTQKAQVINLSLGSSVPCDGSDALSTICDAAWNQGVVVCVAAGNEGPGTGTVGSPGCARKVITVGATDDYDAVANFSSRGPTMDGRTKPDICFPGVRIVSARANNTSMGNIVNQHYTEASGTSMATPHCSGAVALLLQARPQSTPDQIKGLLMQTAHNLGLDANTQGAGRADIARAFGGNGGPQPKPGCLFKAIQGVTGPK